MELQLDRKKRLLYLEVYQYYKQLILDRKLLPGSRMPSLRKCSDELHLSRTTVENAYLQLAADGYIISRAQSGYYVTDIAGHRSMPVPDKKETTPPLLYDLASSGVDRESFRFDLWRRYIKSALRQDDRLLSYGEPQGEADLRQVLADYVREHRNVLCSAQDIVIGAGIQSLLHILVPLLEGRHSVSFPTRSFVQGSTIFSDYGFDVQYRDKNCDVIYVSPAHMTKWGAIMPVSRRLELVRHALAQGSLIIEDDFENEFVYLQKPTPSLFGLSSGENVVYLGTFSRLLLPSIRLSFMVLPPSLSEIYRKKAARYNQTASKAEQIALCQFIRDGHLASQTRRLKRLYAQKLKTLAACVREIFGDNADVQTGPAGTSLALTLRTEASVEHLMQAAAKKGLGIQALQDKPGEIILLLSCSSVPVQDIRPACEILRDVAMGIK